MLYMMQILLQEQYILTWWNNAATILIRENVHGNNEMWTLRE